MWEWPVIVGNGHVGVASGVKEGSVLDHIDLLLGHKCSLTVLRNLPRLPPPYLNPSCFQVSLLGVFKEILLVGEGGWRVEGGGGRRV